LIDAAIGRSLRAHDLIKLRSVEIDCRRRGSPGGRRERRLAQRQRVADGLGHLDGIAMSAEMHVESQRLGAEQVIVERCDFNATFEELGHYWADLGLK